MTTLIDGLSLGSIYALIALGYTMVYGIAKMLNFAHGDIIMVGAYSVFLTLVYSDLYVLAVIFSIVVCVVLGVVVERVAYKPLRGASPLAVLITAIGVSNLLQSIAQLAFESKSKPVDGWYQESENVESVYIGWKLPDIPFLKENGISTAAVVTFVVSAVIMVALTLFIKNTKTGRAMVAVSEDKDAARLMGINVNMTITVTFTIGSALAACAGMFYLLQIPNVEPTLGAMPGIKAFTAAVIGGIGSIPGAMLGGVILGVIEKVCLSIPAISPYTTAIQFGLLILILLIKPTGFLGKKIREKV